jgi:hypothetical protein
VIRSDLLHLVAAGGNEKMNVQQAMDLPMELISIGLFLAMIAVELVAGLYFAQPQSLKPGRSASQANLGQASSD